MNIAEMSENQLKSFIYPYLELDFHVEAEVRGTHIVEQVAVVADFLLRPRYRNFERWLIQRDIAPDGIAVRTAFRPRLT